MQQSFFISSFLYHILFYNLFCGVFEFFFFFLFFVDFFFRTKINASDWSFLRGMNQVLDLLIYANAWFAATTCVVFKFFVLQSFPGYCIL